MFCAPEVVNLLGRTVAASDGFISDLGLLRGVATTKLFESLHAEAGKGDFFKQLELTTFCGLSPRASEEALFLSGDENVTCFF